jgi:hypothetical protein
LSNRTPFAKSSYAAKCQASSIDDQGTATTFASDNHTARFNSMEADIQKHQTAIARHQSAFKSVHERFDSVEDKAIRTMEVCQASSKSILELREESFQQLSGVLRDESAASILTLREEAALFQTNLQDQLSSLGELIRNMHAIQSSSSTSTSSSSSASLMSTGSRRNSVLPTPRSNPSTSTSLQAASRQNFTQPSFDKKRDANEISKPIPDQDYEPDGGEL